LHLRRRAAAGGWVKIFTCGLPAIFFLVKLKFGYLDIHGLHDGVFYGFSEEA